MTQIQFNEYLNYMKTNHPELYSKFSNNFLGVPDDSTIAIFKPAKVSEEDYNEIMKITKNWLDANLP